MEQPLLTGAGLPVPLLGVFYAGVAALGLVVSRNLGWLQQRFSARSLMHLTGFGSAVALIAAGLLPHHLVSVTLVFLIVRMGRLVRFPVYSQLSNEYIPSQSRATTLSLLSIADSVFDVLFLTLFANLATLGFPLVFLGSAALCLLGALMPVRPAAASQPERDEIFK